MTYFSVTTKVLNHKRKALPIIFGLMLSACNAGASKDTTPANSGPVNSPPQLQLSNSGYITEANNLASYFKNDELKLLFAGILPFINSDGNSSQLKAISDKLNGIQITLNNMQITMNNIQQVVSNIYQSQLETQIQMILNNIDNVDEINNQYHDELAGQDIDSYIKSGESSGTVYQALENVGDIYKYSMQLSESCYGSTLAQITQHLHQKVYTTPLSTDVVGLARENNAILLSLGQNILMTLEKSRQLELAALYYNNHSTNSKNKILLGEDIGCNGYGSSDDYKQCLTKINDIFDIREHKVTEYLSQEQETYTSLKNNLLVVKLPGGSWDQSCSTEVNNKDFYFDGVTLQDSCPIAKGNQSNIMPISIGICNNTIIENHDGYLACQAYNDIGHTDSCYARC